MKYLIPLSFIAALIFFARCAQQTSPTGGPQDTIPPKLILSNPPNKTVNFKENRIELTFDEDVVVNNPREQLLITPSVGNKVEMESRKKNVVLNLNSNLNDTTTYTINFRESIQDITEKNPAENLQLAFSTGPYLDSLTITGNVFELLSGKELEEATVALYIKSDTFDIFKHKPIYLTKSNEKGSFEFNNLKPGAYRIYAFNDKNKNLLVDSKTEHYGFLSEVINLQPDSAFQFEIPIIPLDARELKLTSARPYNTYFNIKLSKNLDHYRIQHINEEDSSKLKHIYGEDQTSVRIFFQEATPDSIPITFQARDSIGNVLDTILYAKSAARRSTPEKFITAVKTSFFNAEKNHLEATFKFNKPIRHLNFDSIEYQIDSTHTVHFTNTDFTWSQNANSELILIKKIPTDQLPSQTDPQQNGSKPIQSNNPINKLILKKAFFISSDNDSSQAIQHSVTQLSSESTGIIVTEIKTSETNFLIEVLTKEGAVYQSQYNITAPVFKNLPPGNYQLRMIIDKNSNGKWDSGNFYKNEEPEPIVFYLSETGDQNINIKANWELGPLLISYP